MKISTKGRYALRLMLDLALHDSDAPVRIKDIAAKSIRGPQGGYKLARDPESYTVGMILRLTEGSLAPVACLDDEVNTCDRQETCATLKLWQMLDEAIKGVVDRVTLADLVEWQTEMIDNYVI